MSALVDPEFELKIREREPVDLDDALRIAQRFEVFKSVVESSTPVRSRVNRQATKFGFSDGSTSESQKHERRQQQGQSRSTIQTVSESHDCFRCNCCRSTCDAERRWKEEISERLSNLEMTKTAAEQKVEELKAENEALKEKIDKFRFPQQSRGVPSCSGKPSYPHVTDAPVDSRHVRRLPSMSGLCFRCGQAGHFQRGCPYRDRRKQQRMKCASG